LRQKIIVIKEKEDESEGIDDEDDEIFNLFEDILEDLEEILTKKNDIKSPPTPIFDIFHLFIVEIENKKKDIEELLEKASENNWQNKYKLLK